MRKSAAPRHLTTLVLPLLLLLGASPPATPATGPTTAPAQTLQPATCGKIARLHALGDVYLAGQPSAADLAEAKKIGIKTVINLRPDAENKDFDERRAVEAEGLAYVHIPVAGARDLTDDVFDKAREQLRTAERPLLLHCATANRVGAVWLPYRVLDGGLAWDAALAEAKTVGLRNAEMEAKAKDYVSQQRR